MNRHFALWTVFVLILTLCHQFQVSGAERESSALGELSDTQTEDDVNYSDRGHGVEKFSHEHEGPYVIKEDTRRIIGKIFNFDNLTSLTQGVTLTLKGKPLDFSRFVIDKENAVNLDKHISGDNLYEELFVLAKKATIINKIAAYNGIQTQEYMSIEDLDSTDIRWDMDDVLRFEESLQGHPHLLDLNPPRNEQKPEIAAPGEDVLHDETRRNHHRFKRKATADPTEKWTMPVPWRFVDKYSEREQNLLRGAMAHWESLTCVKFKEAEDNIVGPHLKYEKHNGGCTSFVGKKKKGQRVELGSGCFGFGIGMLAHEIGHALGFYHEHERPDRDRYVDVHLDNIHKNQLTNFVLRSWKEATTYNIPYDYGSLLHYRPVTFSINKTRLAMEPLEPDLEQTVGNKNGLSFYDAKVANYHYCQDLCPDGLDWKLCQHDGYRDPKNCSQCRCPDGWTGTFCTDVMPGINATCGINVLTASQTWSNLTSPNYPQYRYRSFAGCTWLIKAPPNKHVMLRFEGQVAMNCYRGWACYDYIEVRYQAGLSRTGPKYCCSAPTKTFVSEDSEMLLLFRVYRGFNRNYKGFWVQYKIGDCGGCGEEAGLTEEPCRKTVKFRCDGTYTARCEGDAGKNCKFTRKNLCYHTVASCCTKYDMLNNTCVSTDPVHGKWGEWTTRRVCSVTCGNGMESIYRTRLCDSPAPARGGRQCVGDDSDKSTSTCSRPPCPVDGEWSDWSMSQTDCSQSCGNGSWNVTRTRHCIGPYFGGQDCVGPSRQSFTEVCNVIHCPVNGYWSNWTVSSTDPCSVTCGRGTKIIYLIRKCIGPTFGGADCAGDSKDSKTQMCTKKDCPVDGHWSEWRVTSTGSCSTTCGGGIMLTNRTRTCSGRTPGGKQCKGPKTDSIAQTCSEDHCPIDGNWGQWRVVSSRCSVTCGKGTQTTTMRRFCDNPQPRYGGKPCPESSPQLDTTNSACVRRPCPVDGKWGAWETSVFCSVTCGEGIQTRFRLRKCDNPPAKHGGKPCPGKSNEKIVLDRPCMHEPCVGKQVNGHWGSWQITETCSVTCGAGAGVKTRIRYCDNPAPSGGGRKCDGGPKQSKVSTVLCYPGACPAFPTPPLVSSGTIIQSSIVVLITSLLSEIARTVLLAT